MTNSELKEIISNIVMDEDECNQIIVLEGDEYADGAIGLTSDNHVVYDYDKLVESLMKHNNWTQDEAVEWLDYNTLGSLGYMSTIGNEPIILMNKFDEWM